MAGRVFGAVGLLQTALLMFRGFRANVASAYLLTLAGFIWFLVSVAFWGAYPPAIRDGYPAAVGVPLCVGRQQHAEVSVHEGKEEGA